MTFELLLSGVGVEAIGTSEIMLTALITFFTVRADFAHVFLVVIFFLVCGAACS